MACKCISLGQLDRNLGSKITVEATRDIDLRQLFQLGVRRFRKFAFLARKVCLLCICLGTDRNIFARRHGHGSGHQAGKTCDQHLWLVRTRRSNADDNGPSMWRNVAHLLGESGKQLGTVPAVSKALLGTVNRARKDPAYDSIFHAPQCVLNGKITGSRRFAAQSYCLKRIKAVCKAYDTTVNDVVMAMCATALRTYLMNQDALPEKPLVAMVPVSLRKDDSSGGNQVGIILASLGTHLNDAAERLRYIHEDVKASKERYANMSPEEILNYTALLLAPAGFNLLTGLAPKWQTFNVVISNIPGPKEPSYWNGARLEGMYPVSIAMDRIALNMTLTSYCDQVEFGLIGCRRTLPSLQRMLDYLEDGLAELEAAAGM